MVSRFLLFSANIIFLEVSSSSVLKHMSGFEFQRCVSFSLSYTGHPLLPYHHYELLAAKKFLEVHKQTTITQYSVQIIGERQICSQQNILSSSCWCMSYSNAMLESVHHAVYGHMGCNILIFQDFNCYLQNIASILLLSVL